MMYVTPARHAQGANSKSDFYGKRRAAPKLSVDLSGRVGLRRDPASPLSRRDVTG